MLSLGIFCYQYIMQAKKHCLILAAGFGTRMGPIGKVLPKVMWSIYEQSLLQVQLSFARKLGYQNIWINLHHQADTILEETKKIKAFEDVRWLREHPEILDIGGAIHHLASQPEVMYDGELLVLNADQVLWFTKEELEEWKSISSDWTALLLNWSVNSTDGYNQVVSNAERDFVRVVKNSELPNEVIIETYSGNSVINLKNLKPHTGVSAFFESVCNPAIHKCKTALLKKGKYWDFGTAKRYWSSMFEILELKVSGQEDHFTSFLSEIGAFDLEKFNSAKHSYGCDVKQVINLGEGTVPDGMYQSIILDGPIEQPGSSEATIYYNGLTQTL